MGVVISMHEWAKFKELNVFSCYERVLIQVVEYCDCVVDLFERGLIGEAP